MKINKLQKGQVGYIDRYKKNRIINALLWGLFIGGVFLGGYLYYKTRMNYVTIAAVVCVLPAAKVLVALIVMLPYKSCDPAAFKKLSASLPQNALIDADLVLTRREGSMLISAAVITHGSIFAWVPAQKADVQQIKAYLTQSIIAGGSSAKAIVFDSAEKLAAHLNKLPESEAATKKCHQQIRDDLLSKAM